MMRIQATQHRSEASLSRIPASFPGQGCHNGGERRPSLVASPDSLHECKRHDSIREIRLDFRWGRHCGRPGQAAGPGPAPGDGLAGPPARVAPRGGRRPSSLARGAGRPAGVGLAALDLPLQPARRVGSVRPPRAVLGATCRPGEIRAAGGRPGAGAGDRLVAAGQRDQSAGRAGRAAGCIGGLGGRGPGRAPVGLDDAGGPARRRPPGRRGDVDDRGGGARRGPGSGRVGRPRRSTAPRRRPGPRCRPRPRRPTRSSGLSGPARRPSRGRWS